MTTWRNEVIEAIREIGGQGTLSQIYAAVQSRASRQLPPSWQAIVRRELEYNSADSQSHQKKHDLFYSVDGIGAGVWGLRELEMTTPEAIDIVPPERTQSSVYRILRDTEMARRVKKLHSDRCQLCGTALRLAADVTYSEAHHIRPLGSPHDGPDVPGNIMVLCPTHHVLLDYGAMELNMTEISTAQGHKIDRQYVDYHNLNVARVSCDDEIDHALPEAI